MFCDDCCLICFSTIGKSYFNSSLDIVFSCIIIEDSHWCDVRGFGFRECLFADDDVLFVSLDHNLQSVLEQAAAQCNLMIQGINNLKVHR